jgi:hypothetical protein
VPAKPGDKVYLYTQQAPDTENWEVYNVLGERLAVFTFASGQSGFWDTSGVGRGLYFIKISLTFQDGSVKAEWLKAVIQ